MNMPALHQPSETGLSREAVRNPRGYWYQAENEVWYTLFRGRRYTYFQNKWYQEHHDQNFDAQRNAKRGTPLLFSDYAWFEEMQNAPRLHDGLCSAPIFSDEDSAVVIESEVGDDTYDEPDFELPLKQILCTQEEASHPYVPVSEPCTKPSVKRYSATDLNLDDGDCPDDNLYFDARESALVAIRKTLALSMEETEDKSVGDRSPAAESDGEYYEAISRELSSTSTSPYGSDRSSNLQLRSYESANTSDYALNEPMLSARAMAAKDILERNERIRLRGAWSKEARKVHNRLAAQRKRESQDLIPDMRRCTRRALIALDERKCREGHKTRSISWIDHKLVQWHTGDKLPHLSMNEVRMVRDKAKAELLKLVNDKFDQKELDEMTELANKYGDRVLPHLDPVERMRYAHPGLFRTLLIEGVYADLC